MCGGKFKALDKVFLVDELLDAGGKVFRDATGVTAQLDAAERNAQSQAQAAAEAAKLAAAQSQGQQLAAAGQQAGMVARAEATERAAELMSKAQGAAVTNVDATGLLRRRTARSAFGVR